MRWKPCWSCIFKNANVKSLEQWIWQYILSRGALTYILNSNNIFPNSEFFLHYHADLHIELPHNKRPCLIDGKFKILTNMKYENPPQPYLGQQLGRVWEKPPQLRFPPLHHVRQVAIWAFFLFFLFFLCSLFSSTSIKLPTDWWNINNRSKTWERRKYWCPNLWRGSSGSQGGQSIAEPGSLIRTSKQFMICVTSYPQRATIYAHWWFPTKWETSPWIFLTPTATQCPRASPNPRMRPSYELGHIL